jgi:hypothetical protein
VKHAISPEAILFVVVQAFKPFNFKHPNTAGTGARLAGLTITGVSKGHLYSSSPESAFQTAQNEA